MSDRVTLYDRNGNELELERFQADKALLEKRRREYNAEADFADESFEDELVIYQCKDGWRVYDQFGDLLFTAETDELVQRKIAGYRLDQQIARRQREKHRAWMANREERLNESAERRWRQRRIGPA